MSTPALIGNRPIVIGQSSIDRSCSFKSRRITCRVSASEACTLLANRRWKCAFDSRTSTESRIAITVAERGSPVNSAISPMAWPRAISRTSR